MRTFEHCYVLGTSVSQVLANCNSLTIQRSAYDYYICITEKETKVWKLNNMWLISCNSPIKDCCSRRKVWKEKIWKWFSLKTGGHRKGKTCPGSHHIVNDIAGFLLFIQWAYEVKGSGKKHLLFSYVQGHYRDYRYYFTTLCSIIWCTKKHKFHFSQGQYTCAM